ncbi:Long-chain-fatty-acid--CoA ligase [Planococcus massiliensis]|uniref:Long-chain-fatty-acid--CoA ligase n=1 Tax=Planococcus massiliensis TaxID=1499687 RepID=A0A098EHE9_9BACL|nr:MULTISPECIES: AMP-binding protein [Planococcus]MCJ1907973.1 AMP-binding protein [Planococcus ruber]CEG21729.1 Long-chain-fatty-acid--CoA ligase [Planococcus massiliensis]
MNYQSVPALLAEKSAENPDKEFVLVEDRHGEIETMTYREFQENVQRLASVLSGYGIQKGDKVLLHLPNGSAFMLSWFAILSIGAVMVPTNILSTREEMDYLTSHSESKLIITEKAYEAKFTAFDLPLLFSRLGSGQEGIWLEEEIRKSTTLQNLPMILPEDEAAILYTSGTTSKPKGVVLTHYNYLHTGQKMSEHLGYQKTDRPLIVLPMFHGNGQYYMAMPALYAGASIAITETFSATNYMKQAKRMNATIGSLFSAPIKMILKKEYDPQDAENKMRLIIYAQALTDEQYTLFTERYQVPLRQLYGMTETVAIPLMRPLNDTLDHLTIGEEVCGYRVILRDEQRKEVEIGEEGEITVYGQPGMTIMKEYFKNPQATEETIQENWLYTGDMARKDPATGRFYFVDRKKDMMKRAGENIAAGEVEAVLNEHEAVFESAVVSVPDPVYEEAIHAFVILKEGASVNGDELVEWCKERMAKFKVPQEVHITEEFPRTSVGKIQKHQMKKWI